MFKKDGINQNSLNSYHSPLSNDESSLMQPLKDTSNFYLDPIKYLETTRKVDKKSIPYAVYSQSKSPYKFQDTLTITELLAQLQLLVDSVFDCQGDLIPDIQLQTQKLIIRLENKFKQSIPPRKENLDKERHHISIETQSHLKQQVYQLQKELDNAKILIQLREEESHKDREKYKIYTQNAKREVDAWCKKYKDLNEQLLYQSSLNKNIEEMEQKIIKLEALLKDQRIQIIKMQKINDSYEVDAFQIQDRKHEDRQYVQNDQKDVYCLGDTLRRLEDKISSIQNQDDNDKLFELISMNQMLNTKIGELEKYIFQLETQLSSTQYRKTEVDNQHKKIQKLKEKLIKEKAKREEIEGEHENRVSKLKRSLEDSRIQRDYSPSHMKMTKSDYSKVNELQNDNHILQMKLSEIKNKYESDKQIIIQMNAEKQELQNFAQDMKTQIVINQKEKELIQQQLNQKKMREKKGSSISPKQSINSEELNSQINEYKQKEALTINEIKLYMKEIDNLKYENEELKFEIRSKNSYQSVDDGDQLQRVLLKLEQAQFQIETLKNQVAQQNRQHSNLLNKSLKDSENLFSFDPNQ